MKEEKVDSNTQLDLYRSAHNYAVRRYIIGCSGVSGLSTDFICVLFPLVSV